jgi:histidinol-phosphate aminotransferase
MYRFYAEVAGASIREIAYSGEALAFPLDEVLKAIRPDTRAVLIANPNNPTGTAIGLDAVRSILERAENAAVLIDEAYFEFYGVTALGLLGEFPNLFVSRTFSKVFGMAAMRMGCMFSQAENVAFMHKAQSPYSVNTIATMAAQAAIRDTEYVRRYVAEALDARAAIYEGLKRLGIGYVPSEANFVLFRAGERALEVRDKLREMGILVRDRSYELPGCVRVTCGTKAQAKRFLDELERIWKSR